MDIPVGLYLELSHIMINRKAPITIAVDFFIIIILFSKKIILDSSCESSARLTLKALITTAADNILK